MVGEPVVQTDTLCTVKPSWPKPMLVSPILRCRTIRNDFGTKNRREPNKRQAQQRTENCAWKVARPPECVAARFGEH